VGEYAQKVSEVMTADFPTVLEDEPLTKVLGFFADKGVDVVVVVSRIRAASLVL
jgi:predicted transcriptional regulator